MNGLFHPAPAQADRPNIHQQIEELQRELGKRPSVYQRMVSRGELRQSEADERMVRMRAALETLIWCRDHRELLAAFRAAQAVEVTK